MSEVIFAASHLPTEKPAVRVAVTELCNLACLYCPDAGDSVAMQAERLGVEGLGIIVRAAIAEGFKDYSLTGGEPLLTPQTARDTFELADTIRVARAEKGKKGYLKLNSNGRNILPYLDQIVAANFTEAKISLDTLDPDTFRRVAQRPERMLTVTIEGIKKLRERGVPIRLQTVVGGYNFGELPNIIDFCADYGINLKIFDVSPYDNALAGSSAFARDEHIPLSEIYEALDSVCEEPPEIKFAVGNYGHPKRVYRTKPKGGISIEIRDTANVAHYSPEICLACPKYMCTEAISNLVIAADGHLRVCREGGAEQTISNRNPDGSLKSTEEIRQNLVLATGIFVTAQYTERDLGETSRRRSLPLSVVGATACGSRS